MRIDVLTLFPEMFESFLEASIVRRAQDFSFLDIKAHNLRDYSKDKHRSVDEPPYGGGAGMVLGPQPFFDAVSDLRSASTDVILFSPQGSVFDQELACDLAQEKHLILIAGHYEGIDERVRIDLVDREISIGDFILTGGEVPAMVVIDAVTRLVPGVLGNKESAANDSFATGLLEHPHYTRPQTFNCVDVPDILLSGNHEHIALWREKESFRRTLKRRIDLLNQYRFSKNERKLIREVVDEEIEALEV